ncbi:MAG: GntR family transcriptional regulator [Eubacteriales bacterium]|nr:GntR family transcriptional regulator [Eubacteriales bacterium]
MLGTPYTLLALDRSIPIPLYYQIKTFIKANILDGTLRDGACLPPEEELCVGFGVSRPTVRQALSELAREGYLNRTRSKGTFITHPKVSSSFMQTIQTYDEETRGMGLTPRTRVLSVEVEESYDEVRESLALPPGDRVIALERLRYADEEPMVYVRTFLPYSLCHAVLEEDLETHSLYHCLAQRCGIQITHLSRQIQATAPDDYVSGLLCLPAGAPILYISTLACTGENRPFEFSLASYRGDRYRMDVALTARGAGSTPGTEA